VASRVVEEENVHKEDDHAFCVVSDMWNQLDSAYQETLC